MIHQRLIIVRIGLRASLLRGFRQFVWQQVVTNGTTDGLPHVRVPIEELRILGADLLVGTREPQNSFLSHSGEPDVLAEALDIVSISSIEDGKGPGISNQCCADPGVCDSRVRLSRNRPLGPVLPELLGQFTKDGFSTRHVQEP